VIFAEPLGSALLFRVGAALIGFGGGLFSVGTLTAAMGLESPAERPGAGRLGRRAGHLRRPGHGLGGALRDVFSSLATNGALGDALASPPRATASSTTSRLPAVRHPDRHRPAGSPASVPVSRRKAKLRPGRVSGLSRSLPRQTFLQELTMGTGAITTHIDVAQLVLYAFWIFFAGLIYYLVRENHREGYPMESPDRGTITGWPVPSQPKVFKLADGRNVEVPNALSKQTLNARPINRLSGAPLQPVGNPLLAGVGPGSGRIAFDEPDLDFHGQPRILPLSTLPAFGVESKDPDPRGMPVLGACGGTAGTVKDLWVDTSDMLFRYLQVELAGSGRHVLVPVNFTRITRRAGVKVGALYAKQFADIPGTRHAQSVTSLEEEKIMAYFGAGLLYADERRAEPLL
jgi:photosynthetic reaction center H subunit